MKYFIRVDGAEVEVEVIERLGELRVAVGGEERAVTYEEVDQLGQVAVQVDGRTYGVSIEGDMNSASVSVAGDLYDVEIEDEREHAAHAADRERGAGGGTVKSVMPGVVVSLLVEPGQAVEQGQSLLILEAMKMQNEIAAPVAGTVAKVHVSEGQVVAGGERLLAIDPA